MKKLLLTACLLSAVSLNIKAQKGESAASMNALLDVTESGDCVFGSSLAISHNFTKRRASAACCGILHGSVDLELGGRCQLSLSFAGLIAPEVVSDSRRGLLADIPNMSCVSMIRRADTTTWIVRRTLVPTSMCSLEPV